MATSPSGRAVSDSQLDAQIEATLQAARDLGCEAAVKKDIELFDLLAEVDENDLVNRLTTQYKLTHEKVGLIIKGISDEDFFFLAPHLGITENVIARARLVWKGVAPPLPGSTDAKSSADSTTPVAVTPAGVVSTTAAATASADVAPPPPAPSDDDTPAAPGRKNSSSTNSDHNSDLPPGGTVFTSANDDSDFRKDSKSDAKLAALNSLISPKGSGGATASFVVSPPASGKDEKGHSYAEITHSFTIVSRQIDNGLASCKRVIAFIKKFTAEQTKYAKELIAITAHESEKIHKLQDDGMRRYNNAFGGFQEAMLDVAKIQQDYSNKILAEVVTPLTDYHAKAETRRKAIMEEEKKFTGGMKSCTDALNKQKVACLRMLDALKTRKEKKTKEEDDKKKGQSSGSFLTSLKSKVTNMTESTMEEQTDKCYKELQLYQQAIKTSNEKAKQYYTVDLPRIFDALQQLETQRLNTLRDYMKKYCDIQSGSMEPFKGMCTNLGRKVGSMDARGDMNEWVASIIKQHGPTPELRPFTYDLPITPEDVKANRLEPSENANTLFRSTLPRVMELQKAKYPSLELPKLIVTLVAWIREFEGGVKTKGLFRISASKEELTTLKRQLEKGDYDTKSNTSPHVAAGLLKEFLRELAEPLFPQDLYQECVNSVKDVETISPAEMSKKVLALFDRLPPLTQRVIKFVGALLREVSSPENAALNLMTMDNLAIVFAPSLLRCPHDDPMEMLSNSKFETRFTAMFGSKTNDKLQRKNEFTKESLFKSICLMQVPTQLLKFGSSGKPGFRYFQLTEDLRSLTWQSKSKAAADTKVDMSVMKEIKYGQRTEKFKRNNRPDLEHLSFSIVYDDEKRSNETLDLVCKDEKEFQLWTKTFSTLLERKTDDALMEELRVLSKARDKRATLLVKEEVGIQGANDVYAFGWGEWGQNGFGVTDAGEQLSAKLLETLLGKGVNAISCGWSHTLVLLETGIVMAYGNRTATGLSEDYFVPTPVAVISDKTGVNQVVCGAFHCAALTSQGALLTWGCNLYGQLGHGDNKDVKTPTYVEDLLKAQGDGAEIFIDSVACGGTFTACLTEDGKVYTWGCGDHGVLGHNDSKDQYRPKVVNDLLGMDVRRIAAGDGHMFACTDRETYGWGWNFCGQLGITHTEDQYRPHVVEVLRGNQVESIACGAAHTVAVVLLVQFNSHLTYSWGSNGNGQLGQSKQKRVLQPTPIPKIGKQHIVEVQCGAMHTLVRTENGEVWSSGLNKYGQLGHGNTLDVDEFKLIDGLKGKNARMMACGGENSAVLTARAWVEDNEAKECMACKKVFSFVIRKHHCRNCGGIFCNDCSSKKMAILKYGVIEPVRVCGSCFVKLGGR